jgi:hypothetical protein
MDFNGIEDFLFKVFGDGFTEGGITLENQESGALITSRDMDLLLDFVHLNEGSTILVYLKTSLDEVVGHIVTSGVEATFQLISEDKVLGVELYDEALIDPSNDAVIPLPGASTWSLKKLATTLPKLDLSRPISISVAAAHTSDVWKKVDLTIEELIGELTDHKEGIKEGTCLLQGHMFEAAKATRKAAAMLENHILCLDLDNGTTFKEIDDKMGKLGLAYVRYTTHSHNGTTTDISKKQFAKFFGEEEEVTLQKLREWLQVEKGFKSEICASASSFKFIQKIDGDFYQVTHDPISKNRIIVFLDKPFALRGEGAIAYATDKWKERYLGFAEASGLAYDRACTDAARLFYFPRHPKGRTDFEAKFFDGDSLDLFKFSAVRPATLRSKIRKTKHSSVNVDTSSPLAAALSFTGSSGESSMGKLIHFNKTHSFEIVDALKDYAPEMVIDDKAKGGKGSHITCPNEDMHSKSGGSGTYAVNASASESGEFELFCTHAHCYELGKIGLLNLIFENETLPFEILEDENYSQSLVLDDDNVDSDRETTEDEKLLKKDKKEKEKLEIDKKIPGVLDDMNKKYALVQVGEEKKIIEFVDPYVEKCGYRYMSLHAFKKDADCYFPIKSGDTSQSSSDLWMLSRDKRNYEKVVFDPSNSHNSKLFNTFIGFKSVNSKKGDWSKLKNHLFETMCKSDEHVYNVLITWIAHIIQRPWEKPGFAIVMSGGKGTGKTFFAELIMKLAAPYSAAHNNENAIAGNFNYHLSHNMVTFLDEGFYSGSNQFDSSIKAYITSPQLSIEKKGQEMVFEENFTRFIIASNSESVIKASPTLERRYFCFNFEEQLDIPKIIETFNDLHKEVNSGGIEAFKHDLENWVPPFEEGWGILMRPPSSEALRQQQEVSSDLKDQFFIDALKYGMMDASDTHDQIDFNVDIPNKFIYSHVKSHFKRAVGSKRAAFISEGSFRKLLTKYLDARFEQDSVNMYILTSSLKDLIERFNKTHQLQIKNESTPKSVTLGRPTLVKLQSTS